MKYYSTTTHEECTVAQFLAEQIIIRRYKRKKQSLPFKFWNEVPYKSEYVKEIIAANTLLKVYNETAIVNAVMRKDAEWMTSLRIKKWITLIKEEQEKINRALSAIKDSQDIVTSDVTQVPQIRPAKSKLDRLKDF
jgi:hypothetical protein